MGVTVEAEVEDDFVKVWDVNWQSVLLFLDLETSWRCVSRGMKGMMQWQGLDYAAACALLQVRPRRDQRRHPAARLLEDLRLMEREALPIMNESAE